MNPLLLAGVVAGLALLLTAALTPVVRGAAIAGGMVRQVQADRWHRRPTPAIGGVAIFLGFGLALGAGYVLDPNASQGLLLPSSRAVLPISTWEGLVLASTLAFLVGLVDDFLRLPPLAKLAGQTVAASVLLLSGIGVWLTGWYPADAALSIVWFVGITNALNLLDNMDGLATGVAAIAAAYLTVIFLLDGSTGLAVLALGFAAALMGFLVHNYPPARIFMGDAGSHFLGLLLAGLALAPAEGLSRSLAAVMAAPVLILGVPILDTTLVTVGRILEGRPVSQGGRDHTSHRFVELGLSEHRTLWVLWAVAAAGGGVGLLLRTAQRGTAMALGALLVGMITLVGAYLLAVRFRALEGKDSERLNLYRLLVRSQQRYPVLVLLLDAVWLTLAYYGAYLIRWDPAELPAELPYFERTVVLWVGIKLVAFVITGVYGAQWPSFGLYDSLRVLRSNVVAVLLATAILVVLERVGLSRGVVAIDLLVSVILTVGARFSFRLLEGTARRWSETGTPAVLLGAVEGVALASEQVARIREPRLRVVGAAAPDAAAAQAFVGGVSLFGGQAALRHALDVTGARAVIVAGEPDPDSAVGRALRAHLERDGGVDVFHLVVTLRRADVPWRDLE